MRKYLTQALASLGLLILPANADEIGIVDNQKILEAYPKYRKAEKTIESKKQQLDEEIASLRKDLQENLQNPDLSRTQKLQKQRATQKKFKTRRDEFAALVDSLRQEIEGEVRDAVAAEAKAQDIDVVLSKGNTLYGGQDITEAVAERLSRGTR
jgi:outer membrane protein